MTPERIEVLPGALSAIAWSVELATLGTPTSCWFFLSDGLVAHGWREVAVAIPGLPTDDPHTLDDDVLQLLGTTSGLAEQGRHMGAGGFLEFKPPSPGGPTGVGFIDARFFNGIGLPAGALVAFPLLGGETAAALSFGLSRVMARIGQHFRFYPCLPLWDLSRPAVGACAGDETSMLRRLPKQLVPGLSVTWAPDCAVAHADIGSRNDLVTILKQAPECCALLIPPNPAGDGMLVWEPGQSRWSGIGPPLSQAKQLSACFLVIARGLETDQLTVREDGVILLLTLSAWERLCAAVSSMTPLDIPAVEPNGGKRSFILRWEGTDDDVAVAVRH